MMYILPSEVDELSAGAGAGADEGDDPPLLLLLDEGEVLEDVEEPLGEDEGEEDVLLSEELEVLFPPCVMDSQTQYPY